MRSAKFHSRSQPTTRSTDSPEPIEHNLDVIKTADWIIDLGGGAASGQIVATGTPEEVVKVKESYTGRYLAQMLGKR